MSGLNVLQRGFIGFMRVMTRVAAGYDMGPIQEEMVRLHGVRGAVRLMKMGAEITDRLTRAFGEATAQLLIGIAAMWNGCRYCVIGHYSANLFLYRDQKVLGPLDEDELIDLMRLTDDESLEVLRQRFAGPEHARVWHLLERMFQLRFRDLDPSEPDDTLLKATVAYWEWLNECTIVLGIDAVPGKVPAIGFMRPNDDFLADYARARASGRARHSAASSAD